MRIKQLVHVAIGALALAALQAFAQSYPNKPIKIVVGAAAGGPTDIVARMLGERMARSMGAPVIVENRGGGGGVIASELVARAEPDGYTLLMGSISTHGINPSLYKKLNYDAIKDFAPISQTVSYPMLLVVNPQVPAKSVPEFIDYAKKNGSKITRGSAGNGTSMHLAGELFNSAAGTQMLHVPFKGSAPAVMALLAGQIDVDFESIPVALPHVQSGKLRAIGVTSAQRLPTLPQLPAIAEFVPGYEFAGWLGLLAPARTPPAIIDRLHVETVKALEDPELKKSFQDQLLVPVGSSPVEFRDFIRSEIGKLAAVVKSSGATVD